MRLRKKKKYSGFETSKYPPVLHFGGSIEGGIRLKPSSYANQKIKGQRRGTQISINPWSGYVTRKTFPSSKSVVGNKIST
jgi:hypothetical protein